MYIYYSCIFYSTEKRAKVNEKIHSTILNRYEPYLVLFTGKPFARIIRFEGRNLHLPWLRFQDSIFIVFPNQRPRWNLLVDEFVGYRFFVLGFLYEVTGFFVFFFRYWDHFLSPTSILFSRNSCLLTNTLKAWWFLMTSYLMSISCRFFLCFFQTITRL